MGSYLTKDTEKVVDDTEKVDKYKTNPLEGESSV
jgi:hypothetical protein